MKPFDSRVRAKRVAAGAGILLAGLLVTGVIFESIASSMASRRHQPPGELIDVGGHRLHLHCMGEGSPVAILDAGGGPLGSLSWRPVHAQLAELTRVCAYDRAGILWSDRGPEPRSGAQAVAELSALIERGGIGEPVVLVGHSFGGQLAVRFAHEYPERVAGLVLVDASHPALLERLPPEVRDALVPSRPARAAVRLSSRFGVMRIAGGDAPSLPNMSEEDRDALSAFRPRSAATHMKEIEHAVLADGFAPRAGVLGHTPVAVVSAGAFGPEVPSGWRPEWSAEYMRVWGEMQDSLAAISHHVRRIAVESDHMIHWRAPEAVVDALRSVLLEISWAAR